jgi:hypothetical protein
METVTHVQEPHRVRISFYTRTPSRQTCQAPPGFSLTPHWPVAVLLPCRDDEPLLVRPRVIREAPLSRNAIAVAPAKSYVEPVWCRSLAGCSASWAMLRRPSALLSIRQRECCFRLAGRS